MNKKYKYDQWKILVNFSRKKMLKQKVNTSKTPKLKVNTKKSEISDGIIQFKSIKESFLF